MVGLVKYLASTGIKETQGNQYASEQQVYLAADVEALHTDVRGVLERVHGHTECDDCRTEVKALLARLEAQP